MIATRLAIFLALISSSAALAQRCKDGEDKQTGKCVIANKRRPDEAEIKRLQNELDAIRGKFNKTAILLDQVKAELSRKETLHSSEIVALQSQLSNSEDARMSVYQSLQQALVSMSIPLNRSFIGAITI